MWTSNESTVVEALDALAGGRTVLSLPVALAVFFQTIRFFTGASLFGGGVIGGLVDHYLPHEGVGVFFEGVLDGLGAVVLVNPRS